MKMMATYNRESKLNVRKAPSPSADVVGVMRPGDTAAVEVIEGGWCKVDDGYIRADLVTVRLEGDCELAEKSDGGNGEAAAGEGDQAAANAGESAGGVDTVGSNASDDDAEALQAMTIPQLRELAEQSDIKIPSTVKKKDDIIAAILAND